jgi:hypothetical protein
MVVAPIMDRVPALKAQVAFDGEHGPADQATSGPSALGPTRGRRRLLAMNPSMTPRFLLGADTAEIDAKYQYACLEVEHRTNFRHLQGSHFHS